MNSDNSKQTIDVILAAKALMERDLELGLVTEEQLRVRFIKSARKETAKLLAEKGFSTRKIAEFTGASQSQIVRDLAEPNGSNSEPNGSNSPAIAARQKNEVARKEELARPVDTVLTEGLHHGDFRELSRSIADESVQLIFTDPPYDKDSVPLYGDAAAIAKRILKPGGSFIAYSGQRHLPAVLKYCSLYLDYWWTIAGVHSGGNQILNKLGVRCGWKPLVWFVKGTRGDVQNVLLDVVSGGKEKESHEWQQSEEEAKYYIEKLTTEDGTVVDFFSGSGTTAAAAKGLNRKCISIEINAVTKETAGERVEAAA